MSINIEMPLNKARELMAQYRQTMPINLPIPEVDNEPPETPNVLVDAATLGGPSDAKQKKLVMHVLIKDLNKIATRLKKEPPRTGIFGQKAPMGLYALFDGQSCAGTAGPFAAEFCARNFHTKLLDRLASLANLASIPDEPSVEAALKASFEDLDQMLLTNQPDIKDGCGAAVCLLIGEHVFTALLGRCDAVLGVVDDGVVGSLLLGGGPAQISMDLTRLKAAGVANIDSDGVRVRHPMGMSSPVSRAFGDRAWKHVANGGDDDGQPLVIATPEVQRIRLLGSDVHPFLFLAASPVAMALGAQELVDLVRDFRVQPRAACGSIVQRAVDSRAGTAALAQCTAVQICFLPPRPGGEDKRAAVSGSTGGPQQPPVKKAKILAPGGGTQSVRLRHILLKYQDGPQPAVKTGQVDKKPTRTRQEAEAVLRGIISEFTKEVKALKKPPKDATELVTVTTKKFVELCKAHSECETAQKGGNQKGDMGWVTPEDRASMGASFKEVVDVLSPGQFSDIAVSDAGLHLIQRIA